MPNPTFEKSMNQNGVIGAKPLIPIGPPKALQPMPYKPRPIVMRPIFFDPNTNEIIDRTPSAPEKQKPFSDILKKK